LGQDQGEEEPVIENNDEQLEEIKKDNKIEKLYIPDLEKIKKPKHIPVIGSENSSMEIDIIRNTPILGSSSISNSNVGPTLSSLTKNLTPSASNSSSKSHHILG
jgi:hypothetical protein